MTTKIATGFFALAVLFAGNLQAEAPADGLYKVTNSNNFHGKDVTIIDWWCIKKVGMKNVVSDRKSGVYEIRYVNPTGKFYSADNSDAGTEITKTDEKKTLWVIHENSKGWSVHHSENMANCFALYPSGYKLRRANAGGRGNSDQLFKMEAQ